MTRWISFVGVLAAAAACSDEAATTVVDAAVDSAPDAAVCERLDYPMVVRPVSVDLGTPTTLTLGGAGTRCAQIIAALTGPVAGRPPELAQLDVTGVTTTCEFDTVTSREIVRLRAPMYAGLPLYHPVQDALVHVDASNTVRFLHADYLPLGASIAAGCLGDAAVTAAARGQQLPYLRFAACTPQGEGSYPLAADDELALGAEGLYLDEAGGLRRVRVVDAYLLAAHATPELINSDLYCCTGPELDHCVGQRLFIDVITGALVGRASHCITC